MPLFRDALKDRGKVADTWITDLAGQQEDSSIESVFQNIGKQTPKAAEGVLSYLDHDGDANELLSEARRYIFLKGNDSHDYKFSSAVLEDFYHVSPAWRNRYLASSVFKLRGPSAKDNGLVDRIKSALA